MEEIKKPEYYLFNINGKEFDVNDLLTSLSDKLKDKCDHIQFNYLSNSIEYILRSFSKGQTKKDIEKAINNLNFLLKTLKSN